MASMNKRVIAVYNLVEPNDAPVDEQTLLYAAQRGDHAAFGRLVRMYQRRAYAAAYGIVGNQHDALELAQEGFARAFKAMGRFDVQQPFYPWLYRIVKNICLNHLKKKRRHGEVSLDGMMENGFCPCAIDATPRQAASLSESRAEVRRAIEQLPAIHREILVLRHFEELSYQEMADCLGIAPGTVMSRLHTARKKLRETLEKNGSRLFSECEQR
jgi:RNA polymerase sigma-70 factor, ECF subfamily